MQQPAEWEVINQTQPYSHSTWHLLRKWNVPTVKTAPARVASPEHQGRAESPKCNIKLAGGFMFKERHRDTTHNEMWFDGVLQPEPALWQLGSTGLEQFIKLVLFEKNIKGALIRQNIRIWLLPFFAFQTRYHQLSWCLDQALWTILLRGYAEAAPSQWPMATHELYRSILHHRPQWRLFSYTWN